MSTTIGKILANFKSPAYTEVGGNRFENGQCTWYADGRFKELHGINLSPLLPPPANGGQWYNKIVENAHVKKLSPTATPVAGSVASFNHKTFGHVVVVESVSGNTVFYSEYNWNKSKNAKIQTCSVKDFRTLHGCTLNGYIIYKK